ELLPLAAGFTEELRERLLANLGCLREALEGEGSPYRVLRCSGGWTAVLELPRVLPEEDLALGLLREEGVFAHPGYFFDFPREAFLALSLLPRPEDFREGTGRLRAFLDRLLA
ncbi:MAG TPA: pyridoxal phosphate-dependent aminotransferase, partial [Spirochaetia bacterium]|nr:pyridoxal phosphate-dependent aminotransferase [Spirochaetia bacterium]